MTDSATGAGFVADAVREAARASEPDRYLAALLAPWRVRMDLVAIAAFAAELSRVRQLVHDPMVGEIRLQWWRDALHALSRGEHTGNPAADALGAAMQRHGLTPALLEPPIDANARALYGPAGGDARDGADGEAALFAAASRMLGVPATSASETACRAAGTAYAIARGPTAAPAMREEAREALASARGQLVELGPRALVALLPLVMVEPYLHAQERGDADSSGHLAQITPLSRVWRIWRAKRRGRL